MKINEKVELKNNDNYFVFDAEKNRVVTVGNLNKCSEFISSATDVVYPVDEGNYIGRTFKRQKFARKMRIATQILYASLQSIMAVCIIGSIQLTGYVEVSQVEMSLLCSLLYFIVRR